MKRGCPSHPKTYELAALLGIRHVYALGHLELLFHFTAQYAPQGDIGRYSDKRIAVGLEWASKPEKLIESLVAAGWLDRDDRVRLVVHDWSDHADRSTLQRLSRQGKTTLQPNQHDTEDSCTQSETYNHTPPRSRARGSGSGSGSGSSSSEGVQGEPLGNHLEVAPLPGGDEVSAAWERCVRDFPGEVIPDRDMRGWLSIISTPGDVKAFFCSLAAWKLTRKWQEGYVPTLRNYLRDGQWKVLPKPDPPQHSRAAQIMEQI